MVQKDKKRFDRHDTLQRCIKLLLTYLLTYLLTTTICEWSQFVLESATVFCQ